MPEFTPAHIAIIGGGFSGLMTAVNLARLSKTPLRVSIVNHQRPTGRGVAYGMRRPEHVLNVAARNMSAFGDQPDHFLKWLRTRADFDAVPDLELRERFIPRMIYGDYLRSIMQHHLECADDTTSVTTEFVNHEAIDMEIADGAARIRLANGDVLTADRVVLATGNEPPAPLPGAESLGGHPAWIGDPWQAWDAQLPAADGQIVILGTGLTTVDAIITLRALGWMGGIHAISRHGWFPQSHFRGIEYPEFPPAEVDLASLGLEKLTALVEKHCAALQARVANPAIIVDKLRPHTQRIWGQFSREEKLTFARKHAARWSIFRHRIAPDIHAQVTGSQMTGQLQVEAAGIERVAADGDRILVHLDNGETHAGDLVINATGPSARLTASRSTLLQNLLRRGLIAPDDTDMGVRIDPDHTVVLGDGMRSNWLLALGPLLRGTLWETIAVPELRTQARRVAETLLDHPPTVQLEAPATLEYMI